MDKQRKTDYSDCMGNTSGGKDCPSRSRVVKWILDEIASGRLKPGDAVPTVDELSSMLGVARNTAAAAIIMAERHNVLERRSPGARKRYVPIPANEAKVISSAVYVLGDLGCFFKDRTAPRWSDAYLALELIPRLSAAGKHVFSLNFDVLSEDDVDAFFRSPPAGVVITSTVTEIPVAMHALTLCRESRIPTVVYGNAPELRAFDRVYTDHRAGSRDLTRWLLARGCRRIVPFFPFEPNNYWQRERIDGYAEAMREAGLEPLPCTVFGDAALEVHTQGERRFRIFRDLAVAKLVTLHRGGAVDALLCLCDVWSQPVIAAIRELGFEPNRDILVAGYDNMTCADELGAVERALPIVTVDKHNEKTATDMVALLLARMAGRLPPEPQSRTHEQELVEQA